MLSRLSWAESKCCVQYKEQEQHSRRRIADLLHKADAVDKAEHERVAAALASAQTKLAEVQADVARLKPLADQTGPLQARVDSLQASNPICSA